MAGEPVPAEKLPDELKGAAVPADKMPEMTPEQFTAERQRASTKQIPDASRRSLGFAVNAAATGAQLIPGVGPLAAGAIGAGGSALNQILGLEPRDISQIALQAALPIGSQKLVEGAMNIGNLPKWFQGQGRNLTREIGKFVNPTTTRKAGVEAGMETLGATPNAIQRANQLRESKVAYDVAEAQGALPADVLAGTLDEAMASASQALPAKPALKYIQAARENILSTTGVKTPLSYKNAMDEVQGLRNAARGAYSGATPQPAIGQELDKAAARLIDKMDEVSPAIKAANAEYRKEESVKKIAESLRQPRADKAFEKLIEQDSLVRGAIPFKDQKTIESVATELSKMGASGSPYSGVSAKVMNFLVYPLAQMMQSSVGMAYLRQSFKPVEKAAARRISNPQALWSAVSFWRAYNAATKDEQPRGK